MQRLVVNFASCGLFSINLLGLTYHISKREAFWNLVIEVSELFLIYIAL